MASTKYVGTGVIAENDYHDVRWEGLTKGNKAVKISIPNAVNLGNIDLAFVEKNDTVAQVVFTGTYGNTDTMSESTAENFTIEIEDGATAGANEIILGAGYLFIDNEKVALTRGGGSFNVTRTFRNINADGDRGPVKGRIEMTDSTATLTVNTLQILTKIDKLYPGLTSEQIASVGE